jgi:hypothetical protein
MPNKPILSQRVLEQHTLSRYERERRTRKIVVIGSIVVAVLVLLLIGAFVYQQLVYEPNRAAATVGGKPITVSQLQARQKLQFANLQYSYSQLASQVQQLQSQSSGQDTSFLLQYYQQQLQQMGAQASTDQVARSALQALIDEKLIRQEAARRNISVTQQEVEREFQYSVGYYSPTLTPFPTYTPFTPAPTEKPAATATPAATVAPATGALTTTKALTATGPLTPTPTEGPLPTATPRLQPTSITQAQLEQDLQNGQQYYKSVGFPASDFMSVYETSLLTKKLQDAMASETPTMTQHYKFDYVRFNEAATATQYLNLLSTGKITFDEMITQSNTITQPVPIGLGAHDDWTSKDSVVNQYGPEVQAALESLPLNKPSGVITSPLTGAYFIVLPRGREVRALSESDLTTVQQKQYSGWLTAARADTKNVQNLVDPLSVMSASLKNSITTFQQNLMQSQGAPAPAPGTSP